MPSLASAGLSPPPERAAREAPTGPSAVDVEANDGGDWPRTPRLLPWLLAAFLAMVFLTPFDVITVPLNLPTDDTPDRILLPLIVVLWVASLLAAGPLRPRLRFSVVHLAVAVLVLVAILSVLVNGRTLISLGQFDVAVKKLALLFSWAVLFTIVASTIRPAEVPAFARLVIGLACITAIGTIWEYRTGDNLFHSWTDAILPSSFTVMESLADPEFGRENVTGPTVHPLGVATLLAMALPFAVVGLARHRWGRERVWYAIATALILAGSFATVRRTGALAPMAAMVCLFCYMPRAMVRILPMCIVLVFAIQALSPGAISRVKAQVVNAVVGEDRSVRGRSLDYDAVTPDVLNGLLIGRGYGTYDPQWYRYLDNEYLGRIIETGLLGLLSYLLAVVAVIAVAHPSIRSGDPRRGPPALAIAGAAAAFGVASCFFDLLAFAHVPYLFFFLAGLAVACRAPAAERSPAGGWLERPALGGRARRVEPGAARVSLPPPDLSVLVVTHNDKELALTTLRSARASTGPIRAEWLVADSGSVDGTPEAIEREWSDVRVTRLPNVGFAAGNNAILGLARGRYVLLLNPDVDIIGGTLADLVAAMDARPEVGVASVVQQAADGTLQPSIRRFPSPLRQLGEALFVSRWPILRHLQESEEDHSVYAREQSADWLVGAFLIVRREALEGVGLMDERFFLYSEEKDWCYRLRRAGWDVRHLPVMRVTHHTGRHCRADLAAQLSYAKLLFAQKHLPRPRALAIRGALILGHAIRCALFSPAALVSPRLRARATAERAALGVSLGITPPPFDRAPRPGA